MPENTPARSRTSDSEMRTQAAHKFCGGQDLLGFRDRAADLKSQRPKQETANHSVCQNQNLSSPDHRGKQKNAQILIESAPATGTAMVSQLDSAFTVGVSKGIQSLGRYSAWRANNRSVTDSLSFSTVAIHPVRIIVRTFHRKKQRLRVESKHGSAVLSAHYQSWWRVPVERSQPDLRVAVAYRSEDYFLGAWYSQLIGCSGLSS